MANKLIAKRSSVAGKVPATTDLDVGEIAVNLADRKIFTKDSAGTVVQLGGSGGVGTWLNFNGTTTGTITPRAASGIATIVRSAAGRYAITFSTAAANANYIFAGTAIDVAGNPPGTVAIRPGTATVNGCELDVYLPGLYTGQSLADAAYIHGAFIGL
jgi:hypothetical protein